MESSNAAFIKTTIETSIRLILFFGMIVFCYIIMMPFLSIILGGIVLAVAAAPVLELLQSKFKMSEKWGAIWITLVALIVFIVPSYFLIHSLAGEFSGFLSDTSSDKLVALIEKLKNLPLVDNLLYDFCKKVTQDSSLVFKEHASQIEAVGVAVLVFIISLGNSLLHFLASIFIAGFFLANAKTSAKFADKIFIRIAGKNGEEFSYIAERTIQNVIKGIIGVAFIETVLTAFGLFLADVPLAGVWTIICLLISIVQIGVVPLFVPIIIYMYYTADPLTASLLAIWLTLIFILEHFIKPILLSQGAPVPMPIIFVGVIGGFVAGGFIGMFLGAILFSIAYKLFLVWLENDVQKVADQEDAEQPAS